MVPTVEYLPIDGLPEFRAETTKLILGEDSKAIAEGRVACCQSLSGAIPAPNRFFCPKQKVPDVLVVEL